MEDTEKREVCQGYTIKMYPEEIARFKRLASEMDNVKTQRDALNALMDFFENPKTVVKDNPELIKRNQELAEEIVRLKQQLEELTNSGNDNALTSQRLQLELEAAHEEIARLKETDAARANRPANIFEVEVHPVAFHFLKVMAEKTKKTPGYILTDLFIRDLQNPRSNNLPYIVSTDEIRKVMEEYRKAHPEEN